MAQLEVEHVKRRVRWGSSARRREPDGGVGAYRLPARPVRMRQDDAFPRRGRPFGAGFRPRAARWPRHHRRSRAARLHAAKGSVAAREDHRGQRLAPARAARRFARCGPQAGARAVRHLRPRRHGRPLALRAFRWHAPARRPAAKLSFSQEFMLLDEPFSALDAFTKADMHVWFLDVAERFGTTAPRGHTRRRRGA